MSQLSALVKYRNSLLKITEDKFDDSPFSYNLELVNGLMKDIGIDDIDISKLTDIVDYYSKLNISHKLVKDKLNDFTKDIDQKISAIVNRILNDRIFTEYRNTFNQQHKILDNIEAEKEIVELLKKYISNWRYPGMVMYPRSLKFVSEFVTLDPLYILFMNQIKEEHILSEFTDQYSNRLRKYEINDMNFSLLPNEQLATIYCHDLIKHIDSKFIDPLIDKIFPLLRSGGYFIFGYINSDSSELVDLFEHHRYSYYNNRMLQAKVNELGAELVLTRDWKGYGSLAIIKKSGELKTVKAHQALGMVKNV